MYRKLRKALKRIPLIYIMVMFYYACKQKIKTAPKDVSREFTNDGMVFMLAGASNWNDIDCFMEREYRNKWVAFRRKKYERLER